MSNLLIIIGAGAAGLVAAGAAAEIEAPALLLEKMDRPGRKLRLTGNGRCNVSHEGTVDEFIAHYGATGPFLRQAFGRFFVPELVALLKQEGVRTFAEPSGEIFPASNSAQDVVDALVRRAKRLGVELRTGTAVRRLLVEEGRIAGVETAGGDKIPADAVILATGGASYPGTGSSGDGYRLAEAVGHTIVPIRPALVPLLTAGDVGLRLQGLSLRGVVVTALFDGKKGSRATGDILFTHYGLSGPAVLELSGQVVDALERKQQVIVSIDLRPEVKEDQLDAELRRELEAHGRQHLHTVLKALLAARLAPLLPELVGLDPEKSASQVSAVERRALARWIKSFRLEVTGHRPLREAQVTAGGVDTKEVDPRTMASLLVSGLYFAGEVLDIAGQSGGYNLQAAFTTGWVAGRSAAERS